MYIKIIGNLVDVIGDFARTKWNDTLKINAIKQIQDKNENTITYFEVYDYDFLNSKININDQRLSILNSIQDINNEIDQINYYIYVINNEGLMNANITQLINNNQLDLTELHVESTDQEELEFLYNNGISGISRYMKFELISTT